MRWTRIGGALLFVGVALGAFGAHGLESSLSDEMLEVWDTGVRYHLVHGLGLVALGALEPRLRPRRVRAIGIALLLGVAIFSGSLYLLALTGLSWLGAITPLGGVAFLVAWALLAFGRPRAEAKAAVEP